MKYYLPLALAGALALPASAQQIGATSLNNQITVVPAPGAVAIDGQTDDWDLSAGIWSYNDPTLVEKYSVWTHLMWDEKGVYFLARYADQTPLQNATRGKDFSQSWRADAYQVRSVFDDGTPDEHQMHINIFYSTPEKTPYMLVKHGGFKAQAPYDATGPDRPDLAKRYGVGMEKFGGKIAFAPWKNGKGYNAEAFWPWEYLRQSGKPMKAGESFVFGLDAIWGNADGSSYVHRLVDNMRDEKVNRIFFFRDRKGWGKAVLSDKGNLDISAQQEKLQALRLKSFVDYDTYGAIPITYNLPDDREVTIAIDNSHGERVRNLFGQFPRKKGANTELWDGLDDAGKPAPPGQYTATIVDHKPLELKLLNSVFNTSRVPWATESGTNVWGSNHGYPTTVRTRGAVNLVGFTGTEGTTGLLRADANGDILWTSNLEILDVAIGEKYAYTLSNDSWQKRVVLRRFTLDKGVLELWKNADKTPEIELKLGAQTPFIPDSSSIGLAKNRLWVLVPRQKLMILDAETGALEAEVPAPDLIALADRDETLYGLYQGGKIAILGDYNQVNTLFVAKGLEDPKRLAVNHDATRFAVSDGATNQVFVYDAKGHVIQTLGTADSATIRPAGPFVETNLMAPLGLDFDAKNSLWVAEATRSSKRVTRWSATGELEKQFWGSADYGAMAGFPLTFDSTRFIAHGIEFQLDPDPRVGEKATQEKPLLFHPALFDQRGFIYKIEGRDYAVTLPGYNRSSGFLIAKRNAAGAFMPVVKVDYGDARAKTSGRAWIDRNDNGREDDGEVTLDIKGKSSYWSAGWMRPDGAILTADQWFYPLQGFTKTGVPLYDFAKPVKPLNAIETDAYAQGSTGTVVMDGAGNISNGIAYQTVDGRSGAYPNPFGRHDAPAARRGLLIAPFRTNGVVENVPGVGSITALGGDRGEWFLMSMDGLYLSSLLQDTKGEITLDENFIGQESFGGFLWRDEKGRVLVQLGHTSYRIHQLLGLDSTRKNTLKLDVTAPQITEGTRIAAARRTAGNVEPQQLQVARVAALPTAPVDADSSGELMAGAPTFAVAEEGDATRRFRASLAHDGKNLAVMWQVNDSNPWRNGEGRFTHAFIGGDAVDLKLQVPGRGEMRVLGAPVGGKNTVVFWQKTAAQKENPQTYVVGNNAANAQSFDVVKRLESAKIAVGQGINGYSVLLTIPLAELGLDAATPGDIKGVVGVIFSDPAGKNRASRLYWHDKKTGLVSDVPSEAQLNPASWGRIVLEK